MNNEQAFIERVTSQLVELGYNPSAIVHQFKLPSGFIDLVVFERETPKIIIEIKEGRTFVDPSNLDHLRFEPSVRAAQRLAREIGAPFYGIADNGGIHWFDTDETGRPRLLPSPVLPARPHHDSELHIVFTKELIARTLWSVIDAARSNIGTHEYILFTTIAIYARVLTESGEPALEQALTAQEDYLDILQFLEAIAVPQQYVVENKAFFVQAFRAFSQIAFLEVPVERLLLAFDELLLIRIQSEAFKLPRWLTDFFVQLADIGPNDQVLDLFSNFGDVAASITRSSETTKVVSIVTHSLTYLWASIQARILRAHDRSEIVFGQIPPTKVEYFSNANPPSKIIVSPPFNIRLSSSQGRTELSEDVYLSLALERVAPGGRIVAIVPEGFLFSHKRERRELRSAMLSKMSIRAIISLDAFMPNTSIKTSVLVLDKVPTNEFDQVLLGRVQRADIPFDIQKVFHCRQVSRLAGLLDALLLRGNFKFRPGEIWAIPARELTADNFAVTHYSQSADVQPSSTYPTVALPDVAEVFKGSSLTLDEEGDLLVIGPAAVRKLVVDPTKLGRTRQPRLTNRPVVAEADDIVFNALNNYAGQAALVGPEYAGYFISRNIIVIRLKRNYVSHPPLLPDFLAIALNSTFVAQQLTKRKTGSVIPQITKRALMAVLIPVPELHVQRQIIEETTKAHHTMLFAQQMVTEHQNILDQAQATLGSILEHLHTDGGVG